MLSIKIFTFLVNLYVCLFITIFFYEFFFKLCMSQHLDEILKPILTQWTSKKYVLYLAATRNTLETDC